jgi:DNA-binding GntR family transcriptional regulator
MGSAQSEGSVAGGSPRVPVRRQTVTELALDALRERIVRGVYPEGMALRQDALASDLGVSRIPIREALRQLEAEGLVTLSPHHGATVSSLSFDEIHELSELRALIESELLRHSIPRLTDLDFARAGEILDSYEAAFQGGDVGAWGHLNWSFHSTLLAPAGRPLTLGVAENLQNQSDRYMRLQLSLTAGQVRANDEHRAILEAVTSRDLERACGLLVAHIIGAGESLLEFLREHRGS